MVPRIPFDAMDVLICCELGKNISGTGMDPAIVGRPINNRPNVGPDVTELGILSITPQSEGNGNGIGMGNFISRRVRDELDESMTVINALTGMKPFTAMIPPTMETDELVLKPVSRPQEELPRKIFAWRLSAIQGTSNESGYQKPLQKNSNQSEDPW